MSAHDLFAIHQTLVAVALKAGQTIASARPSIGAVDTKKNSSDLVTETDRAVEDLVSSTLSNLYPSFDFLGEETYKPGMRLGDGPTFVCDPIDGTTNFVHGHPYVSISLAFVDRRVPRVGVVYNPFRREIYHAVQDHGAFLTQLPPGGAAGTAGIASMDIKLSDGSDGQTITAQLPLHGKAQEALEGLDKALVAIEWGNERSGNNWDVKVKTFSALAGDASVDGAIVHSLRSLGSAALNLCGVATGHLDAYWEGGCWAWDVAAGWVVLTEAGGKVVGGNKNEWDVPVDCRRYLAVRAAGGGLSEQKMFIEQFWSKVGGTLEYDV